MSNHSIIEHRANYHYLRMEEDYLAICSNGKHSPHCKAQILSVLESWTNTKKEKGEGEYVYLTMPQWIKYTYMLYERNIITDCIKELLEEKLISRRQIIMFDQKTFEYKLMHEVVNQRIKELPPKDPKEVLPRLDAYIAYREKAKEQAKERREAKKLEQEKEGVGEKSPTVSEKSRTSEVGDKSRTVREKSPEVGDKSQTGYVNNQRILSSTTNLSLTSTKGKEKSASSDDDTRTPSPSFADDELAMAVDYLNANGYQVKFEGQIPGNDLLFWVKTPNGKEYFDTPENIIAWMRTIQQRQQDANTVEANLSPSSSAEPTQEETAERNRFPNDATPLTEKNAHADESLSGIEREMAVRPSSSLVVDSPNAEMTHTDARNTTNSYSPSSTSSESPDKDEAPATPEPTALSAGKGTGKGTGGRKKSEGPVADQYRKVFDTMNEVFRKLHPETPDFKVVESKKAKEAVRTLIEAKGNPALLKLTMFDMWNETDARGDHWWRKGGRMTVPAIIEQYTSRAPGLASKLTNHAATKSDSMKESLAENGAPKPPIVVPTNPLGSYSSRPELQPWKDDGAVSDDALNRESWAAIKKRRRLAGGGR